LGMVCSPMICRLHAIFTIQTCRPIYFPNDKKLNYEEGLVYAHNKIPIWMEAVGGYTLDFEGRATVGSAKNAIVTMAGVPGAALRFGSVAAKYGVLAPVTAVYTLDFQFPFSPLQAFAVGISNCERKVLVE
jgi:hypothetical protein